MQWFLCPSHPFFPMGADGRWISGSYISHARWLSLLSWHEGIFRLHMLVPYAKKDMVLGVEKISCHTGRINPLVYWVDINMRLKLYVSLAMAIHQRWLDPETKAERRHPENKDFCSPLVHSELEKRWLPMHDFWSIDFVVLQKLVEQPFCKLARALCSRFLASINASFAKDCELCSKSEKAIPAHGW